MVKIQKKSPKKDELDVDARFLLANERTLLAWIRTALAILAGGIALIQLSGEDQITQNVLGTAVVLLGGFMAAVGYIRFQAADKAIRRGELPTLGHEPFIQTGGILVVAFALVATHLAGIW
jgi:putative membrane protein